MTERVAGAPIGSAPQSTGPAPTAPTSDPPVAPVAAVAAPAPAVTTTPAPAAAPAVMTPPPAPPAPPVSVPDSGLDADRAESARLREQMLADAEASRKAREIVERDAQKTLRRNRLRELRSMGASPHISDEDLLSLAPDVDAETEDGREALIAWKAERGSMFATQVVQTVSAEAVVSGVQPNALWTAERLAQIAARTIGGAP